MLTPAEVMVSNLCCVQLILTPVCLNSSCATLEEEEVAVETPQLNEESELGLVKLSFRTC